MGRREGAPEAGARAYDIKHYNYYLNSSRMAPGVAALLLVSSTPASPSPSRPTYPSFPRLLSLSIRARLSRRPPARLTYGRAATRFLLSRIPVAPPSDRSFCFCKVALLLLSARA